MRKEDQQSDEEGVDGNVEPRDTRDEKGRWLQGYCPNPKGRPKKKLKEFPDTSDLRVFSNTLVGVSANGQVEQMVRRTALLNKMFETAMKGNFQAQKFLYQELQKHDELLAAAQAYYDDLVRKWVIENPNHDTPGYKIPREIELEMMRLSRMLRAYFPDSYSNE